MLLRNWKQVIDDFGITHFYFIDGTLTLNRKYMLKLCDAIENAGLKFTWEREVQEQIWLMKNF